MVILAIPKRTSPLYRNFHNNFCVCFMPCSEIQLAYCEMNSSRTCLEHVTYCQRTVFLWVHSYELLVTKGLIIGDLYNSMKVLNIKIL